MPFGIGFFANMGGVALSGRLQTLGGSNFIFARDIAVDSSGNSYAVGRDDAGLLAGLLVKYNSLGVIEWQRGLRLGSSTQFYGVAVDSSGNVYAFGPGTGNFDTLLLAQYNSSGTLQWQRSIQVGGYQPQARVAVDTSGNIYVVSTADNNSNSLFLARYNSSGTIQWQRILGAAGGEDGLSIATDPDGNVYVSGYTTSQGVGAGDALIAQYNSSGTIQWQRTLGGASFDSAVSIFVDASSNVYVVVESYSAVSAFVLACYNSSGTIQWQRSIGSSSATRGVSVRADALSNVYVVGVTTQTGAGSTDYVIARYDSTGAIQWQRTLGGAGIDESNSISVDQTGNIYVIGTTYSGSGGFGNFLIGVLPSNGALTGTYSLNGADMIYAVSSLSTGTTTLTSATSTLTASTSSRSTDSPSVTTFTPSFAGTRVDL